MNLNQALEFWRKKKQEGAYSDGCTKAPDFHIRECCEMHDWLIRYRECSRREADVLFFKCMWRKKKFILAPIYFIGVRLQGIGGFPLVAFFFFILLIIGLVKWG